MRIEMRVKDVELILEEAANSEGEVHRMLDKCNYILRELYSGTHPIIVEKDGNVKITED